MADRRSVAVATKVRRALPRQAEAHADRLTFVERLEPVPQRVEDIDTARLVTRFQAGDEKTFALLYERYFDRVYAYLRIALKDTHEAEDCTQQVFVKVLLALSRYERRAQPFRGWLFVIVRNQALEVLRKNRPIELSEQPYLGDDHATAEMATGSGPLDWISDRELVMFVERLPMAQRQVLVLRYMLDLTFSEIADVLDRSQSDVRMQHHRAVRFLQDRLRSVGRGPRSENRRIPASRGPKQYGVLRARRFALLP